MDLNRVMLIGRLGDKPHREEGNDLVRISLATGYKDKTDWHDITLFGRQAEIAEEFYTKGMRLYIECRLNYWKRKVGEKEYKAPSLTGTFAIMLDSKNHGQADHVLHEPAVETKPAGENDDLPF